MSFDGTMYMLRDVADKLETIDRLLDDLVTFFYAFNLCVADYSLGKFGDAKTACRTAAEAPDAALAGKASKLLQKIDDEAKKQGIALPP